MRQQYQIQITKLDNGFLIAAQTDEPGTRQKRLQAADEDGTKKILHDIVENSVFEKVIVVPETVITPTLESAPTPPTQGG